MSGFKKLALGVGAVIIIGVGISVVTGNLNSWISIIWTDFYGFIKQTIFGYK